MKLSRGHISKAATREKIPKLIVCTLIRVAGSRQGKSQSQPTRWRAAGLHFPFPITTCSCKFAAH